MRDKVFLHTARKSKQSFNDCSPFILGWGLLKENGELYSDGGFSRRLHPQCEYRLDLPIVWETAIHSFTLSLNRDQIEKLWQVGWEYDYGIPKMALN